MRTTQLGDYADKVKHLEEKTFTLIHFLVHAFHL